MSQQKMEEYLCKDCLIEKHCDECGSQDEEEEDTMTCKCGFEGNCDEFEYLPSIEDEKEQQILGDDFCLECYKKYECFKFVEHIKN